MISYYSVAPIWVSKRGSKHERGRCPLDCFASLRSLGRVIQPGPPWPGCPYAVTLGLVDISGGSGQLELVIGCPDGKTFFTAHARHCASQAPSQARRIGLQASFCITGTKAR